MPNGINVTNGNAPQGYTLPTKGQAFVWLNYDTTRSITIANAGNWCNPGDCTVPAATAGTPVIPGQSSAQVLENPNILSCAFSSTGWNAPGMPHIQNPGMPIAVNEGGEEREVA